MNIQLRNLHLLIQHFIILQLSHTSFITQSLKDIHSGRETCLIDTCPFDNVYLQTCKADLDLTTLLMFSLHLLAFSPSYTDQNNSMSPNSKLVQVILYVREDIIRNLNSSTK